MSVRLIRHAKAGARDHTGRSDGERPLDAAGRSQARALAARLAGCGATLVLSSPAVRCRQTVAPLAEALGLAVVDETHLAEGADPAETLKLLLELAPSGVVGSSHGDVIPAVLQLLLDAGVPLGPDLRCEKGSTWVLEAAGGRFVRGHHEAAP